MSTASDSVDGQPARYSIVRLERERRPYLLLAVDSGSGGKASGGGGVNQGHFALLDGNVVPWSCATKDAESGRVVIGEQSFDLAGGGLFLVTTDEGLRVEQFDVPLDGLQEAGPPRRFSNEAKKNPGIARFLASCTPEAQDAPAATAGKTSTVDASVAANETPPNKHATASATDDSIPVYPGAEQTSTQAAGIQKTTAFKSDDSTEKILEFFATELPERGWKITQKLSFGRLEATKEKRKVTIDIASSTNGPTSILQVEFRYP